MAAPPCKTDHEPPVPPPWAKASECVVVLEPKRRRLGRPARAGMQVVGESETAQPAPPAGGGAALGEAGPIGQPERLVHGAGEVAAVVGEPQGRRVREGVAADEVAPPQRLGRDPQFAGRGIDQPLDHEVRLRPTGAAIGIDRGRVGEHAAGAKIDRRRGVDAGVHVRPGLAGYARPVLRQVGAEIADGLGLEPKEAAVPVERQRRLGDLITAVVIGQEAFAAVGGPLHRPAEPPRRPQHQHLLGIGVDLHAEAAAHVRRHHAQPLARQAEHVVGKLIAQAVHTLARGVERVTAARARVETDGAARLDRADRDAVVDQPQAHHVIGPGERRLGRR
jgi:hypothetical protein